MKSTTFADLACELLSHGQRVRFRAPGRSMTPTIPDGAAVVIEPILSSTIREGDVVAAKMDRGLVLHRVVGCSSASLDLRGDAGFVDEIERVPRALVAGRVVEVERGGRAVQLSSASEFLRFRVFGMRSAVVRSLRAALAAVACLCLLEGVAAATSDFKVGTFTISNATGTQSVAHGLAGQPKLLILWTAGKSTEAAAANYNFSMGFSDSPGSSRSTAMASVNGAATSNAARDITTYALTAIRADAAGNGAVVAQATLASWNATNFTLNWTTNTTAYTTGWKIHFLAVSGTEVQAKVVDWLMANGTAPVNVAVTGIPFRPDLVINSTVGSGYVDALGTVDPQAGFSLGYMDAGGNQATSHVLSVDASNYSDTQRGQKAGSAVYAFSNALAVTKDGSLLSMDTNGFTVRFTTIGNQNAGHVVSLAIKGANIHVGSFNKSTAAAGTTQSITGLGYKPLVVALWSDQDLTETAPVAQARWGFGATDGVRQTASATYDQDNSNTTVCGGIDKTTVLFDKVDNNTGAIDAEATLSSMDSGGFTLKWGTNDAVATQIFYFAGGTLSPTAVKLADLSAKRHEDDVLVQWRTAGEVDNLGFNVYRELEGRRVRITHSLVAGSALSESGSSSFARGRSYAWVDRLSPGAGPVRYWLEDLDLSGRSTWHGPVEASAASTLGVPVSTPLLEQIGRTLGPSAPRSSAALMHTAASTGALLEQARIAAVGAIKLVVREEGWYSVSQQELLAAGLAPGVDPRRLKLYADGVEQAIRVYGEQDGRLDPGDRLEFYGTGLDTPYTDRRVYWLVEERSRGERIGSEPGVRHPSSTPDSFPFTVENRDRTLYFAALLNGDADNFFGPVIFGAPVDVTLNADALAPRGGASLEVVVQGVTLVPHQVAVSLNGVAVGTLQLDSRQNRSATFPIAAGLVHEGPNVVTLTSQGATSDVSLVDTVRLTYPRRFVVQGDSLRAAVDAASGFRFSGFSDASGSVFDIGDPSRVVELDHAAALQPDGTWSVLVTVPAGHGTRDLLAVGSAARKTPAVITRDFPSTWSAHSHRADALVIGNGALLDATLPLRTAWQQRGLSVAAVDVEDLYDEFAFGAKTPQAVRDFLALAEAHWAHPPRFVLLVGDASFDPRNYLGLGDFDLMPTKLVDTAALETASDDWFADFDGDGIADLAIGRIPARTPQEVAVAVAKTLAFRGWTGQPRPAVFVSDDATSEYDFGAASVEAASGLPAGLNAVQIPRGGRAGDQVRADLDGWLAAEPLFVTYLGHGYEQGWEGDVLTSTSSAGMPIGPPTVYFSMTCLNGFFSDVYARPLAEELVLADGSGATAAWACSGMGDPALQRVLTEGVIQHAVAEGAPLGDAVRLAKAGIDDPDMRKTFVFFGDPTLQLAAPAGPDAGHRGGKLGHDLHEPGMSVSGISGCQVAGGEALLGLVLGLPALLRRRRRQPAL